MECIWTGIINIEESVVEVEVEIEIDMEKKEIITL
jgi:hypothetical protein